MGFTTTEKKNMKKKERNRNRRREWTIGIEKKKEKEGVNSAGIKECKAKGRRQTSPPQPQVTHADLTRQMNQGKKRRKRIREVKEETK